MLETYRKIIMLYTEMVGHLKTLKSAERACTMSVRAMQEFSYRKEGFADEIDKFVGMLEAIAVLDLVVNELGKDVDSALERLGEVEGLDGAVVYLRDVKKMRLKEIADALGYSHQHIKRISSRNPKDATFMIPTND